MDALEFLDQDDQQPLPAIVVLHGDDRFLRRHALTAVCARELEGDDDFSRVQFDGNVELREVMDELATRALFGGSRRLVIIDDADSFVTKYRAELEKYLDKPKSSGVLVLAVSTWPGNTRLAKAVAKKFLAVECKTPAMRSLPKWARDWARRAHRIKLSNTAAEMLVELVGAELGILDQELAKLATLAGEAKEISAELVEKVVGGWRAKTTWEMLDLAAAGDAAAALAQMEKLLLGGQTPVGLLAQMSFSLRRLAAAAALIREAEAEGKRIPLRRALEEAGVKNFVLQKSEQQMRQLGRQRASKLYRWLLEADLGLKGESALPPRTVLEQLIVRMAQVRQPA